MPIYTLQAIPYATGISHYHNNDDRSLVSTFVGGNRSASGVFVLDRLKVIESCMKHSDVCKITQKTDKVSIMRMYGRANFCLNPPGDTATRAGIFDSILMGCIPVVFSPMTLMQYSLHLQRPWEFAVLVPAPKREDPVKWLKSVPHEHIKQMQEEVKRIGKRVEYGYSSTNDDALEVLLRGLHERFRKDKFGHE